MTHLACSIIVPTFNERANMEPLVDRIAAAMGSAPFELIIVDDDSPDRTWEVVEALAVTRPWLRAYRRVGKRGLASAVIDGFSLARGANLICMDGDLQHDPQIIPQLLRALDEADVAVASRYTAGGTTGTWGGVRLWGSRLATSAAQRLLSVATTDPMSGFFALRRPVFIATASALKPRGFKILMALLHRAPTARVADVPFSFGIRVHGNSKLDSGVLLDYLAELWDLRFGERLSSTFVKYAMVGLSGVGVQLLALHLLRMIPALRTGESGWASALAILIAILWNYTFDNRWTFSAQRHRNLGPWLVGLSRFTLVCSTGAFISWSVGQGLRLVTHGMMNIYFASLFGIAVATVWNFTLNRRITWTEP